MTPATDINAWAAQWRTPMLRFARLHLQPQEEAEDAVQDALLAAWKGMPGAQAVDDPRRYLFGILKHKITDRLRQRYRHGSMALPTPTDDLDDVLFDASEHWAAGMAPTRWHTPDAHLESDQFFLVVDLCITRLPAKAAKVFSMKELLECEPDDICYTLGLSKADYWQSMSRARKQLQLCLTQHWFDEQPHRRHAP